MTEQHAPACSRQPRAGISTVAMRGLVTPEALLDAEVARVRARMEAERTPTWWERWFSRRKAA